MKSANFYARYGALFQLSAIISFLFRRLTFWPQDNFILVGILTAIGIGLFFYCLYVLYIKRGATKTLRTTGPFRYTRHPMYTAFALMDSGTWFAKWDFGLVLSSVLFYGALITAGYFQEKETLARFGLAAQEYYRHTPRLFIFYRKKSA